VDGGCNELGKFGVEQLDKEQKEVCEKSLNNYPLKKFHLGFIGRQGSYLSSLESPHRLMRRLAYAWKGFLI